MVLSIASFIAKKIKIYRESIKNFEFHLICLPSRKNNFSASLIRVIRGDGGTSWGEKFVNVIESAKFESFMSE